MEAVRDMMDIGRCYKNDRRTVAEGLSMAGQGQWCTMKRSEGTGCLDERDVNRVTKTRPDASLRRSECH